MKGHFHPKVIRWRGYGAYIGSANLTHNGWFNNIEAGVFLEEDELVASGAAADLDGMFEHLSAIGIPVTNETVDKLEQFSRERRRLTADADERFTKRFNELFGHLRGNPGLTVIPPRRPAANRGLTAFAEEWMRTLQKMRGLAKSFEALGLRPRWVDADAHPAVHFDQFLHAFYYVKVRGGDEDEDDLAGWEKVEAAYEQNRSDPDAALKAAARWWADSPSDHYDEENFIRSIAPGMQARLSREAIATMDLSAFREALRGVNAFRMHARQVRNVDFGLPPEHHEDINSRVDRLCGLLWNERTKAEKTVREILEFVIWGTTPGDMEQRLWMAVSNADYRLPHFGQSTLGEAVGWARPDDYPPRNNRTNKALRALGHNVKLFSRS